MSLPDQMTDRWQDRPEPAPGEGVVSWHLLMRDYPEVVDLARRAQQRLAGFDGLHMTPLHWLHMTTLLAGPAADFSPDKLRQMTHRRGSRCARDRGGYRHQRAIITTRGSDPGSLVPSRRRRRSNALGDVDNV